MSSTANPQTRREAANRTFSIFIWTIMLVSPSAKDLMATYGFVHVGEITSPDKNTFSAQITFIEAKKWQKTIYIFVFNDEIKRIGSSKGLLIKRMQQWSRDVTNALLKLDGQQSKKTNTPSDEAIKWRELLQFYPNGKIYAREATTVTTSIGSFRTYMDEESVLINRYKPPLNRHKNR